MAMRIANIFQTGGNLGLGGFAPGVVTTTMVVLGERSGLIPAAAANIIASVPLMVWGAGAGYAFGMPGEDPTCAALKGAAGATGAVVALRIAGL